MGDGDALETSQDEWFRRPVRQMTTLEHHMWNAHQLAIACASTGMPIEHGVWDSFRECLGSIIESAQADQRRLDEVGEV